MPKVSVIIPTYNSADTLPRAVESVLNQTYADYELIVIDDGSTDNTEQILEPYIDRIIYVHQDNQERAAARNHGIAKASGEYVAFLDADDWWTPDKLEQQVRFLQQNPKTALVYSDYFIVEPNGVVRKPTRRKQAKEDNPGSMLFEKLAYRNIIGSPSFVLVRRDALQQTGGFDESLQGTEDWDLWLRIAVEHKIGYVATPLSYYQLHGDNHLERLMNRNASTDWLYIVDKLFAQPDIKQQYGYLEPGARARALMRSALIDCGLSAISDGARKLREAAKLDHDLFNANQLELCNWLIEFTLGLNNQIPGTESLEDALAFIARFQTMLPDSVRDKVDLNMVRGQLCAAVFFQARRYKKWSTVRMAGWHTLRFDRTWLFNSGFTISLIKSLYQADQFAS